MKTTFLRILRDVTLILVAALFMSITIGKIYWYRVVDSTNDMTLTEKLANVDDSLLSKPTKTQADARFNKVTDNKNAYEYFMGRDTVLDNTQPLFTKWMNAMGEGVKLTPNFAQTYFNTNIAFTAAAPWGQIYSCFKDTTAYSFKYVLQTAGVYNAKTNNNRISLYELSGDTLKTLLATVLDSTLWKKTANIVNEVTFTGVKLTAGKNYAVMFLYRYATQTTAPKMYVIGNSTGPIKMGGKIPTSFYLANADDLPSVGVLLSAATTYSSTNIWAIFIN